MLRALVITFRPRQWLKNLLVAAAPLAAGTLLHPGPAAQTALAFAAFCLASSALYCLNDVCDAASDRHHPRKRLRPVAAGQLSVRAALGCAVVLAGAALAIAAPNSLRVVIAFYLVLSASYSLGLKRQAVIELAIVASGFLLRAVAGGPATGIPLSQWFLMVAGFGSLFVVAGKRLSETMQMGEDVTLTRPLHAAYRVSYLRMLVGVSVAVTCTAYALWAFEVGADRSGPPWAAISVAPFVIALLRYLQDVDAGTAEEPEQIMLNDHVLQVLALLWLASFSLSVLNG